MTDSHEDKIAGLLERVAKALESQNGCAPAQKPDWDKSHSFVWVPQNGCLKPVSNQSIMPLSMLIGIDQHAQTLLQNTRQFAEGFAANNALLWGTRGMGKSALVKAVHKDIAQHASLKLIEIHREDIKTLPQLLDILRDADILRFILFCDDLSFDERDTSYKSLKAVLEGGVEGRPDNVIFYATSNRRHLMPRDMIENENRTAIHRGEAVEEKVSLSDRFGLWLGFYGCDQEQYLQMIDQYVQKLDIKIAQDELHASALEWSLTRGNRSGRVAWQFIQDLAGKHNKKSDFEFS